MPLWYGPSAQISGAGLAGLNEVRYVALTQD